MKPISWGRRATMSVAATTAGLLFACSPGVSAPGQRQATPNSIQQVLIDARGGERIVLAPGDYGTLNISARKFAPALVIDASRARFTGLIIRNSSGVTIRGGTVAGFRETVMAVNIDSSRQISVGGMRVSGSRVGIGVTRSQHVAVTENDFAGIRHDGVNIAASQHVQVERNQCRNFNPVPATFDATGKMLRDGDHPDCVQAWSLAGNPTSDVLVEGNVAEGYMQGVFFVDPSKAGFDRIVIRNNRLSLSMWNGVILSDARGSQVTGNVVGTVPGARALNAPFHKVTTWLKVTGENNRVCGNSVEQPRWSDGTKPCERN